MFSVQLEPYVVKPNRSVVSQGFVGVDSSGVSHTITIPKNSTIIQMFVKHVIGSGSYTLQLFSNSDYSERIFEFVSDESPMVVNQIHLEYQNTDSPIANAIYAKITADSGSGHQFMLRIFYHKL